MLRVAGCDKQASRWLLICLAGSEWPHTGQSTRSLFVAVLLALCWLAGCCACFSTVVAVVAVVGMSRSVKGLAGNVFAINDGCRDRWVEREAIGKEAAAVVAAVVADVLATSVVGRIPPAVLSSRSKSKGLEV